MSPVPLQTALPPLPQGNDLEGGLINLSSGDIIVDDNGTTTVTLNAEIDALVTDIVANTVNSEDLIVPNSTVDSGVIIPNSNVESGVIVANTYVDSANEAVPNDTEGSNNEVIPVVEIALEAFPEVPNFVLRR